MDKSHDTGQFAVLPRHELLRSCARANDLEPLITMAERALVTWQPVCTGFLDGELWEEELWVKVAERCVEGRSEKIGEVKR